MKNHLLLHVIYMTKIFIYAFLIQSLTMSLLIASDGNAQNKSIEDVNIKLSLKNVPVEQAFSAIEKETGFNFVYTSREVKNTVSVSVDKSSQTLYDVLVAIAQQSRLEFKQINNNIHVKNSTQPSNPNHVIVLPEKMVLVSGRVVEKSGEPFPGVSVVLEGSSRGTVTDNDGRYTIDAPADGVLLFSFIGFKSKREIIGNRSVINVTLEEDESVMDEVVVIGYGTQARKDVTGSISSVSSSQLKETPIISLDQGLQGRAAGVQVMQQSHSPGGGVSIRIRGGNSLTAGNEPLYVIDGFPIYSDNNAFAAGTDPVFGATPNALASINPSDIESIEILKDASATAIYGSRGANGVVIVTTKRGRTGPTKIEFDQYYGVQNVARKIPMLNGQQHLTILNEARANSNLAPVVPMEPYLGNDTNWQDEVYQSAPIQNYQLTLTGGDQTTKFAVSGNYFRQDGIITNSNFERGSLRVNLDKEVSKSINVGTSLTFTRANNNNVVTDIYGGARGGVSTNALLMPPIVPVDTSGVLLFNPRGLPGVREDLTNPVALAQSQRNQVITNRLLANVFSEFTLAKGLTFRTSGGIDYFNSTRDFYSPEILPFSIGTSRGDINQTQVFSWLNENTLNYTRNIGNNHTLNLLGGFTQQTLIRRSLTLAGQGFPSDDLLTYAMQNAEVQRIASNKSRWDLLSWIGRANYNIKDKYLFTATMRTDGSSKFGTDNKWGIFPSGAIAWRASEEDFIKNLNVFSDLKIRTSYGITGNQEIGSYQSLPRLISTNVSFNEQLLTAIFPAGPPYTELAWEQTSQFDVGIDMGLFNNRLTLVADYYYKDTDGLLVALPLPFTSGIGSVLQNIGRLSNRGVELSMHSNNTVGAFKWETDANISFNRNKVIALPGLENGFDAGSNDPHIQFGTAGRVEIGQPIGNFFGYLTNGIWQLNEADQALAFGTVPGEVKYVDINGDGMISPEDRTIIGNAQPDYFFGMTNRFYYKGFDFNIFINGMMGFDLLNYQIFEGERLNGANNHMAYVWERWTPENPSNTVPRATLDRPYRLSDRQVEDGSFIRLQNVSLGYTFNTTNIRWVDRARVYISGQNLAILTNYRGYDPEVNSFGQNNNLNMGIDRGAYPAARTILIGTSISF